MNIEEYELFKEEYLSSFKTIYKKHKASRKELKRTVFENPKLTEPQKESFWRLVIGEPLLNEEEREDIKELLKEVGE